MGNLVDALFPALSALLSTETALGIRLRVSKKDVTNTLLKSLIALIEITSFLEV